MLAKITSRKRFAHHLLRAIGALATATCHAQALPKLTQGTRAVADGVANLAFRNSVAEANVHGTPESCSRNPKSQ